MIEEIRGGQGSEPTDFSRKLEGDREGDGRC